MRRVTFFRYNTQLTRRDHGEAKRQHPVYGGSLMGPAWGWAASGTAGERRAGSHSQVVRGREAGPAGAQRVAQRLRLRVWLRGSPQPHFSISL